MRYLSVANVYSNELRLEEVASIGVNSNEVDRVRLKAGDLLIVEGNGSLGQIGQVAVWQNEIADCGHQNRLLKARPRPCLIPKFALYLLLSPLGRAAIEVVASSTLGLRTLSISKVNGLPIPYCSYDEMLAVVSEIERLLATVEDTQCRSRACTVVDRSLGTRDSQQSLCRKVVPKKLRWPAKKLLRFGCSLAVVVVRLAETEGIPYHTEN
jgi:hypothetical protein